MLEKAVFAGGCFWCMLTPFQQIKGVKNVFAIYTGGTTKNPTYEHVCTGETGHIEAVQVDFDPTIVNYYELLETFWKQIDPTDENGQFADKGSQYISAIFYSNEKQRSLAEVSRLKIANSKIFEAPIATSILPLCETYKAEQYHQSYPQACSVQYNAYRVGSGREKFVSNESKKLQIEKALRTKNISNPGIKISDVEKQQKLSILQYNVTQENATEKPFSQGYNDNTRAGIYVDILSGEPLFSNETKFDSSCGWPSFTAPIEKRDIIEKIDTSAGRVRTEVRSRTSHLGHVFDDGPDGKLRYCINSAAIRFVAQEDLEEFGYSDFVLK